MKKDSGRRLLDYNRDAWNGLVENKNRWTQPVSSATIAKARVGNWKIILTPEKPVPGDWFPDLKGCNLKGCNVLCLASAGGQQGPVLAAAGAQVTVWDNSNKQLEQDRYVAKRENLALDTLQGDMADLTSLSSDLFDLIVHPCSNTFVPDVKPVWKEAYRVLKPGGNLLSGFCNPLSFIFDYEQSQKGVLQVRHKIPYSDTESLSDRERQKLMDEGEPLCFGHTLDDQIGGQIEAGFSITGFYEDYWSDGKEPIDQYIASFIATRATKPLDSE